MSGNVRVVKAAEHGRTQEDYDDRLVKQAAFGGGHVNQHDALERQLLRLLKDVREQREELRAGRPAPVTKTLKALPSITHLTFSLFDFSDR